MSWYQKAMDELPVGRWPGSVVYHGTNKDAAEDILRNGVDLDKCMGGYFGFGFYTTPDKSLAQSNYADFGRDDEEAAVIEMVISPSARILDMRDEDDSQTYMSLSQNGRLISSPNFANIMMNAGVDGLFDRSFDGVVIYNPKAIRAVGLIKSSSNANLKKKAADEPIELPEIGMEDIEQAMRDSGMPTFIPVPSFVIYYSQPANGVTDISVKVENGKAQMRYKGHDGKFYLSKEFPAATYKDWKNNLEKFLQVPAGEPLRVFRRWLQRNFGIKPNKIMYEIQQDISGTWENISHEINEFGEDVPIVWDTENEAREDLSEHLLDLAEAVERGDMEDAPSENEFRIVPVEIRE